MNLVERFPQLLHFGGLEQHADTLALLFSVLGGFFMGAYPVPIKAGQPGHLHCDLLHSVLMFPCEGYDDMMFLKVLRV